MLLLLVFSIGAFVNGQDSCNMPPPVNGPGGDTPDDNFSFSSGNSDNIFFYMPGALIYKKGNCEIYKKFIDKKNGFAFTSLEVSPNEKYVTGKFRKKKRFLTQYVF